MNSSKSGAKLRLYPLTGQHEMNAGSSKRSIVPAWPLIIDQQMAVVKEQLLLFHDHREKIL